MKKLIASFLVLFSGCAAHAQVSPYKLQTDINNLFKPGRPGGYSSADLNAMFTAMLGSAYISVNPATGAISYFNGTTFVPVGPSNIGALSPTLPIFNAPLVSATPSADGAQDTTQNSPISALNIYTPITAGGFFYYDTKRDVTVVPPNSTAINTSSHACYLLDNSAASTMTINGASQLVGAGVCDWGVIIANADGGAVWGKAHYLSDTATNGAPPRNSTGRTIVADEEDFQGNALDSSGNPATTAAGIHLLFGGVYKNATGFTAGSRGARNVDEAFTVADGTMKPGAFSFINGIDGSPTGTAPIGSQVRRDDWYDGTQRQTWQHAVQADGGYIENPSVAGKPYRVNAPLFVTGNTTASLHFVSSTTIQQPAACGTSPSATGTDHGGNFVVGTGTVTSCTISYGTPWPNAAYPTLTPTSNLGGATYFISLQSKNGFVVTFSSSLPGASFNYTVQGS